MKRQSVVILAVVATLLLGGIAMAQSNGGNIYTGCLDPGGTIIHVAIGDQPAKACAPSHTQISWNETGPQGPQGPEGPQGPAGQDGADGADGVSGWEIVIEQQFPVTIPPNQILVIDALCPAGKKVIGGGGLNLIKGVILRNSYPMLDGSGWEAIFQNISTSEVTNDLIEVRAICATVLP